MRKIIIIGMILILIGAIAMTEGKRTLTFKGLNGTEVFINNKSIGTLEGENRAKLTIDMPNKDASFIFKKEGYEDSVWPFKKNKIPLKGNGTVPIMLIESDIPEKILPTPEPTPEPTLVPEPTGHKSQKQRITELENITAEQETKISNLEENVTTILNWIKSKFGDII